MEKPLLAGALLVVGAMTSIGAVAAFVAASRPLYAEVVMIEPVSRSVSVQAQECRGTRAARDKASRNPRLSGVVIGGMVGGVIAPQPGVPDRAQRVAQDRSANPSDDRRCRIVNRTEQQVYAYDVRYRLDGRLGKVRMDYAPGERIPVRDGQLQI